jgi:hypothetical protein
MSVCGFDVSRPQSPAGATVPESDRINAVRLMLLKLGLDRDDPRWSSYVLDRLFDAVKETPGGSFGDLIYGLFEVLGDYSTPLAKPVGNFIEEISSGIRARAHRFYNSLDWSRLIQKTVEGPTPAQAYLALLALSPDKFSPKSIVAILRSLAASTYWQKAITELSENLQNEEVRKLLKEWLAEGIEPARVQDVKRILGINDQ